MKLVHGWNESVPFVKMSAHKCSDTLVYLRESDDYAEASFSFRPWGEC
jgi:hypothetical protein